MPSTYTPRNRWELQAPGENNNTWGARMNSNTTALEDDSADGVAPVTVSGPVTLTTNDGAPDEARMRTLVLSGTGGTVTVPDVTKWYNVRNGCSGDVTFTTGSGTTAVVKAGANAVIVSEGSNVVRNYSAILGNMTILETLTVGQNSATAGMLTLLGQQPACMIKDSNTAGTTARAEVLFVDSADVTQGRISHGVQGVGMLYLSGAQHIRMNNSTIDMPNITTTGTAANAFLDSGASNRIFRSTSSLRYKTDVQTMTDDDADKVLQLRPVTFLSLAEADDPDTRFVGFVAEEVAEIDPRLVHFDGEERPDGVQYDRVIVGLLSVVKRLTARVEALENA